MLPWLVLNVGLVGWKRYTDTVGQGSVVLQKYVVLVSGRKSLPGWQEQTGINYVKIARNNYLRNIFRQYKVSVDLWISWLRCHKVLPKYNYLIMDEHFADVWPVPVAFLCRKLLGSHRNNIEMSICIFLLIGDIS